MRNFFIITIDTEVDRSQNWAVSNPVTFRNVVRGIPERLEPLFQSFGAKATYLLSPEVIENDDCSDVLSHIERAELGTHLHGAFIEPERTCDPTPGAHTHEMQSSYSEDVEFAKLRNLTNLFIEQFGYRPTAFRAGRFGARAFTLRCLAELGYLVDSSVTPYWLWRDSYGSADYTEAPAQPYWVDRHNMCKVGSLGLLEVPVSIRKRRLGQFLQKVGLKNIVWELPIPALHPSWVRPSFSDGPKMWGIVRHLQSRNTTPVFVANMMFHSMECMPGLSPYCASEADCRGFLDSMKYLFERCCAAGFEFVTLSELPTHFASNPCDVVDAMC